MLRHMVMVAYIEQNGSGPEATNTGPYEYNPKGTKIQLDCNVSDATYSWTGTNGFTSTLQKPSDTVYTDGTYDYTCMVHTESGDTIELSTTAYVAKIWNDGPFSPGDTMSLGFTDFGEETTYKWEGPDKFSSTDRCPQAGFKENMVGDYTCKCLIPKDNIAITLTTTVDMKKE